jgi:SsrA-binding protein
VAKQKQHKDPEGIVTIADNRRARHDYAIAETFEAGLELKGTEVNSLRDRHVSFTDAYAVVKGGQVFLLGLKIEPYLHGTHENHERDRTRRLLLKRSEIDKLEKLTADRTSTLVPLKLYFKGGKAKVELGLVRSRTKGDRRAAIAERDATDEARRAMGRAAKGMD